MSHAEDRLAEIESLLQELLQRQRLSRFDTLMFLLYPVVIAGSTWILSVFWQMPILQDARVVGVPFTEILRIASVVIFFLILGFLVFAYAYASDNIGLRAFASGIFGFSACFSATAFSLLFVVGTLYGPVTTSEMPQILRPYAAWLGLPAVVAALGWTYVVWVAAVTARSYVQNRVTAWFTRSLPLMLAGKVITMRPKLARPHRVGVVIVWFALCLPSYAFGIAYVVWVEHSLFGIIGYHYWVFTALTATSVFLALRHLDP
jgi:hypothetical protein